MTTKTTIRYAQDSLQWAQVDGCRVVWATMVDQPSALPYTRHQSRAVLSFDSRTGRIETRDTIYVPELQEVTP